MTRVGSVSVSLSRHHCKATAWWLSERYVPYAESKWRASRSTGDAHQLLTAARLAKQFRGLALRRLKGDDQDRDGGRTLDRGDAAWLAALISVGRTRDFPEILVGAAELPSAEALAGMPLADARAILFGFGAYETMCRCHEVAYSRKPGPERASLTLDAVARKHIGNPLTGGDERYARRLRKRARQDEEAAEILKDWMAALHELEARQPSATEKSDDRYPPSPDKGG